MTPAQIEAYVDAAAAVLQLPLSVEHRPGVLHYFGFAAQMAELVDAHPMDLCDEPAEAFVPVSPKGSSRI
jgi:Protein of unknown function (DUF4089)